MEKFRDYAISAICPQYPKKKREITARQLITHTSGIRHYIDYEKELAAATNSAEKSRVEIKALEEALSSYTRYTDVLSPLKTFQNDDLLFKPGTDWEHSSFGYRVLRNFTLEWIMKYLILLIMQFSIDGYACYSPPERYFLNPERMFFLSDGVVLAKAIKNERA